jgi:hypothetical protein
MAATTVPLGPLSCHALYVTVHVKRPDGTVDTYPHQMVGAGHEEYIYEVEGEALSVTRLVFRNKGDESPSRIEGAAYYHRGEWTSVSKG